MNFGLSIVSAESSIPRYKTGTGGHPAKRARKHQIFHRAVNLQLLSALLNEQRERTPRLCPNIQRVVVRPSAPEEPRFQGKTRQEPPDRRFARACHRARGWNGGSSPCLTMPRNIQHSARSARWSL